MPRLVSVAGSEGNLPRDIRLFWESRFFFFFLGPPNRPPPEERFHYVPEEGFPL